MTGQLDYPHGVPEDEYEVAPVEFSLAQARAMLELLYGAGIETIPEAGVGACADCGRIAILLAYCGKRNVCRRCALSRRSTAGKPGPGCTAGSSWTGWRREGKRFVRDPQGVDQPPPRRRKDPPAPQWRYWRKDRAA